MAKARTLFDKIWDSHVVDPGRTARAPLHRPSSRARGDQPAGLRGPAAGRPQGAPARGDAGRRRPQHATDVTATSGIATGKPHPGRDAGAERARIRRALLRHGRHAPGHRPYHRAGAGRDAAGHDHRLRRQPHRDARRVRRAGLRHRHLRGRACAGDADAAAAAGQEHARSRSTARCRVGVTAKDIILAIIGKIGTAGGTGYVIEYAGEAIRALSHGRPHDRLQHVDRGAVRAPA